MFKNGVFAKNTGLSCLLWLLCLVSLISFVTIVITIYNNPKLQAHPMKMFMYVAMLDSYIFAGYLIQITIFNFDIYKLTSATVFFKVND